MLAKGAAPKAAVASSAASKAMEQFKAKEYRLAAVSFHKAIENKPNDSTLYYYYALCLHYCNDINGARATYNQIIANFPGTDAANRAQLALNSLSPPAAGSARASGSRTSAGPTAASSDGLSHSDIESILSGHRARDVGTISSPDECNIHFDRVNDSLVLDVMVNNRSIKMIFDTGAEMCSFGKNHLALLGIAEPKGAPTGKAGGVGDGGVQDTWEMPATVSLGPITRKDFPITVQTEMPGTPLLGQTFFQDFTYTIDNGGNNIHLRRKNKTGGSIYQDVAKDPNAVPFSRMGNEIIVQAKINGKVCPVIFDTGASVCAFSTKQCQMLGINIPDDAVHGTVQGIAGTSFTSIFPVTSLKLGPIEKHNFDIHVMDNSNLPAPLLGQTFYGDWQFTIDYENKYIHFLRR